jgi:hypothetical protein
MLPIGSICSLGGIFTMRESKVWLGVLILVIGSVITSGNAKATNENNLLTKHDLDIIATSQVAFLVSNQKKLEKYENAHSLTDGQLVDMLSAVGFKGKSLRSACAIAKAESNGRPLAFNGNLKTGDSSYGVFQINMLGELGSDRREKFDLDSNAELLNPVVNAQIALHMTNNGEDWSAWSSKNGKRYLEWYNKYPCKK